MAGPSDFREYREFLKAEMQAALLKLVAVAIGGFGVDG